MTRLAGHMGEDAVITRLGRDREQGRRHARCNEPVDDGDLSRLADRLDCPRHHHHFKACKLCECPSGVAVDLAAEGARIRFSQDLPFVVHAL